MAGGNFNARLLRERGKRKEALKRACKSQRRAKHQAHVQILLAQLNGAPWLPDQLYSLLQQTHSNWSLAVSDDGSTDESEDIIRCFARSNPERRISITSGPGQGFAKNFMSLLRQVDSSTPFVAFADQDDKWLPEKLERALDKLHGSDEKTPALYCGRTWICTRRLRPLHASKSFQHEPCFQNAIVQSIGGGNTMVFNNAALKLLQQSLTEIQDVASHDWWAYQVISGAGGRVIYDQEPMVLYRQHEENVIGAATGIGALLYRFFLVASGTFQRWNDVNLKALETANIALSDDNRQTMQIFKSARSMAALERLILLNKSGIHCQTRTGNFGLWVAAVMKRI